MPYQIYVVQTLTCTSYFISCLPLRHYVSSFINYFEFVSLKIIVAYSHWKFKISKWFKFPYQCPYKNLFFPGARNAFKQAMNFLKGKIIQGSIIYFILLIYFILFSILAIPRIKPRTCNTNKGSVADCICVLFLSVSPFVPSAPLAKCSLQSVVGPVQGFWFLVYYHWAGPSSKLLLDILLFL